MRKKLADAICFECYFSLRLVVVVVVQVIVIALGFALLEHSPFENRRQLQDVELNVI